MADAVLPFLQALEEADKLFGRQRRTKLSGGPAGADRIKGGGTDAHLKVREHAKQVAAFGVITIQSSGFVPAFSVTWAIGFATTEPTGPRSRCQANHGCARAWSAQCGLLLCRRAARRRRSGRCGPRR